MTPTPPERPDGLAIDWTVAGDLIVTDLAWDQPKLKIDFYDWRRFTPEKKLRLLRALINSLPNGNEQAWEDLQADGGLPERPR